MRQVIEAMVAMIFIVLLCITGMDLLNVHMQAGAAKEFRNQVITSALNSDYDEEVLEECLETAEKNDYRMKMVLFREDGSRMVYEGGEIQGVVTMMQVELEYEIGIPVLHTKMKQSISATT